MATIISYTEIPGDQKAEVIEGMKEVFFQTAHKTNFDDEMEMEDYYYKWAGGYLDSYPDYFYFALEEDGFVGGYLCGCPDSFDAIKSLDFPGLDKFIDLFANYPAHLHINCHPKTQGKGVGRMLMERFTADLGDKGIKGLHVLTDPNGSSRGFYHKMGFQYEELRGCDNANSLRFIGKQLLPEPAYS